jgi:GH24 family phage-related lysozyme (muramidase)
MPEACSMGMGTTVCYGHVRSKFSSDETTTQVGYSVVSYLGDTGSQAVLEWIG